MSEDDVIRAVFSGWRIVICKPEGFRCDARTMEAVVAV